MIFAASKQGCLLFSSLDGNYTHLNTQQLKKHVMRKNKKQDFAVVLHHVLNSRVCWNALMTILGKMMTMNIVIVFQMFLLHTLCCLWVSIAILMDFTVLGDSGGVVNSLDFCLASLKSLGCFFFRCVLSSQWKVVTVNLQILHCQL